MKSLYSMFLSQAYQDCWDDYNRSVKLKNFPRWDYVILTASNDQQAEGFRRQIEERKEYLPAGTRFAAIPDRDGERVGSGGATLEVLKYLHEQEGDFRNGTVRLSLYADFLYPLAEDSTLEQFYLEKPEGEFCEELTEAREQVWKVLRPYRMKLLRLAPAKFIHFGTTKEILALMCGGVEEYAGLGWSSRVASSISGSTAGYNSVLSSRASIGKDCYL